MFSVEIPVIAFYARFPGLSSRINRTMDQKPSIADAQSAILDALGQMLPSTAAEIAEAAGLDPLVAAARLDDLAQRYRVMFNPLTKRYSLPKGTPVTGIAA
ncbi:hypothetical protein [Pelagibius sp. 7325]|uniref:hypothetical protein n=1 Tax=Pelagibius sp. 7325 TaxID=3131994 RepID=UPI0030EC7D1C